MIKPFEKPIVTKKTTLGLYEKMEREQANKIGRMYQTFKLRALLKKRIAARFVLKWWRAMKKRRAATMI